MERMMGVVSLELSPLYKSPRMWEMTVHYRDGEVGRVKYPTKGAARRAAAKIAYREGVDYIVAD